jgi:Tfp pilus assembly protein PilF
VLFKEEVYLDAIVHLKLAHALLPDYSGYPSPALVLAQIYEQQGNEVARFEQLQIMMQNHQHDYDTGVLLAAHALERDDLATAQYYVDRALSVSPYRMGVHEIAAQIAQRTADAPSAVREYEVLVHLDNNDPVEANTNLAEAYLDNGQTQDARRRVLSALEQAPTYRRAQQILLKSVEAQ